MHELLAIDNKQINSICRHNHKNTIYSKIATERNTSKEYINGHKTCLYFNHVCSVTNQINYNDDYDVIFDKCIKYLYLYIHNWMNMCATAKSKLLHHEAIRTITNDHCSNGQQNKN
jgi:hypothetical protein